MIGVDTRPIDKSSNFGMLQLFSLAMRLGRPDIVGGKAGVMAANNFYSKEDLAALRYQSDQERVTAFINRVKTKGGFAGTEQITLGPDIIARLVKQGDYHGDSSLVINDQNYPISGEGTRMVHWCLIRGDKLLDFHDYVFKPSIELGLGKLGCRFPDAAEALLLPARYPGIGSHGYVAFIRDSPRVILVGWDGGKQRWLRESSDRGPFEGGWDTSSYYMAVLAEL